MKKPCLKFFFSLFFLLLTLFFFRTQVFAQCTPNPGDCCSYKKLGVCEVVSDCQDPTPHAFYREVNNACLCNCVECRSNQHCVALWGQGYLCNMQNHSCYHPGGGSCSNFDPNTSALGTCPAGLHPLVTGPSATSGLYQCACVECTQNSHCCPAGDPSCGNTCDASNHCQRAQAPPAGGPIQTAIGPIDPSNLQAFIKSLLSIAFGVAGGIAFLLMLFGAFQIMTSAGNPEKMKAGSELITSALTGLLFIVFSIFILRLIGVTILDIPGFGQ